MRGGIRGGWGWGGGGRVGRGGGCGGVSAGWIWTLIHVVRRRPPSPTEPELPEVVAPAGPCFSRSSFPRVARGSGVCSVFIRFIVSSASALLLISNRSRLAGKRPSGVFVPLRVCVCSTRRIQDSESQCTPDSASLVHVPLTPQASRPQALDLRSEGSTSDSSAFGQVRTDARRRVG